MVRTVFLCLLLFTAASSSPSKCDSGDLSACPDESDPAALLQNNVKLNSVPPATTAQASVVQTSTRLTIGQIFKKTGTDKMYRHGYHRYYEKELAPYRDIDGVSIMEIGADSGISLGAWMEYFKNPESVQGMAYGVSADAAKKKACEFMPDSCSKLQIYSMDQGNVTALAELVKKNPKGWDIIVDDGSHLPQHQLISFQRLWPNIRPGGLYVIEDIETSYVDNGDVYGYTLNGGVGLDPPFNAVEQFKRLVDVVNRKHIHHPELTVFDGVDKDVAGVNFGDGLIFVQKKPADAEWDKYPQNVVYQPPNVDKTVNAWEKKVAPVNSWFENPPSSYSQPR